MPEIKDFDLISIAESIATNLGGLSIICSAVALPKRDGGISVVVTDGCVHASGRIGQR